ncbi:TIGR02452 family protein [Streptantibioticus parmotrematis]|uniref:TIGR02452 family protein n=1 Tax=Streptantibioticus parmotrematis TaxID=2873249 RepID=UPI0033CB6D15
MSARLRGIAKETQRIVVQGWYHTPAGREVSVREGVRRARQLTRLYGPEPVEVPAVAPTASPTTFEVTQEGSLEAARRLADAPVAVLDFASARNPGGGYLNGAQAQEEALCRASALYTCLREAPDYYAAHRADRSPFYTDRVIHSPAVPVFRDDQGALLEAPFTVGFLASPAPNAGVIACQLPGETGRIADVLRRRAERVLEVAALHGYRRLALGAWGCGVFQNDPALVASAFATHLTGGGRFADRFTHVVFAVLDRRPDSPARTAFAEAFTDGRVEVPAR